MGSAFKVNNGLSNRGAIPLPDWEPINWKILYDTQKTNHFSLLLVLLLAFAHDETIMGWLFGEY